MRELLLHEAIRDALIEELQKDDSVILMGSASSPTIQCTQGLIERFGSGRVIDTPVGGSGIAGAAIGAALAGLRPVVEFSNYNQFLDALAQISSSAGIQQMTVGAIKLPVVFRGPGVGFSWDSNQQCSSIAGYLSAFPGLVVAAPATPRDAKGLLKSAIKHNGPVVLLESQDIYDISGPVPEAEEFTSFGTADIRRSGNDVSLISWSKNVETALETADQLENEGFSAEVIDLRTLHPLDELTILNSVAKTRRAIILQEHFENTSFGAYLCQKINSGVFDRLRTPVSIVSTAGTPIPVSAAMIKPTIPECVDRIKGILDYDNTIL